MPRTTQRTVTLVDGQKVKLTNDGKAIGLDLTQIPEQHRDQAVEMIPQYRIAEAYLHRTLNGRLDYDYFEVAKATKHNILMPGPTGSGKTTAARAWAAARGVPFCGIEMQGGFDFATVVGSTRAQIVNDLVIPEFVYGELSIAIQMPSVCLIDEVNFAPPRFTAAFHGTLDARQSMYIHELGHRLGKHHECVLFSAYNDGYRGIVQLNEAFQNRFAFVLPWDYSPEVEEALVGSYSPRLLSMVRNMRNEKTVTTPIGTNVMEEFITIAAEPGGGVEMAGWLFTNRFPEGERATAHRAVEANLVAIAAELSDIAASDGLVSANRDDDIEEGDES